jgi:hypothetical protein
MENFKSQLNLDALQEIAISNVLTDSMRSQGILLKANWAKKQKRNCSSFRNHGQKINEF